MKDIEKDIKETVTTLLARAAEAHDSGDAMRFSQAALNVAHIKHALYDLP